MVDIVHFQNQMKWWWRSYQTPELPDCSNLSFQVFNV